MMNRTSTQVTRLTVCSSRILKEERLLILADLHQQARSSYLPLWQSLDPTAVLIVGDFIEADQRPRGREETLSLLTALAQQYPVYYSLGNHELGRRGRRPPTGECCREGSSLPPATQAIVDELTARGVHVLHNAYVRHGDLCIGGLTSAAGTVISTDWLSDMAAEQGYRLLLCHHPEYYDEYVRRHSFDLTVSGHAHGGQWRFFGQGIYAPGQGIFPRYTNGYYDGERLLVSRGLADRSIVPRFGNPKQTILLQLKPLEQTGE